MGKYREKPGLATVCGPQGIAKALKRLATETEFPERPNRELNQPNREPDPV
jgi:hypothetical protein